jgi:hypothetical protein
MNKHYEYLCVPHNSESHYAAGVCRSRQFPGLWLVPNALLAGNLAAVLQILQQGIATPDHQALVDQLPPPPA